MERLRNPGFFSHRSRIAPSATPKGMTEVSIRATGNKI